jgi:lysophospholipase
MEFQNVRDETDSATLRCGIAGAKKPSHWLVFLNGRTEWSEKYEHLLQDLPMSDDCGFLTFDHRGQGASDGERAWIDSYDTFAKDLKKVIQTYVGDKPFDMVCHSMGGLIALTAIMNDYIRPHSLVLSSPLLGLPPKPFPPRVSGFLSGILSSVGFGKVNSGGANHWRPPFAKNTLTHSHARYQVIQQSPYPVPSPTFEWVRASWLATQKVFKRANLEKLTMPILVVGGTKEEVVDIECFRKWVVEASKYSQASVEFFWISGGKHELLFESPEFYNPTIEKIRSWLERYGQS